jgi:hypothetical protein
MTLKEAVQQYEDNATAHAKYEEAKSYLRAAAEGDPSHEVKSNGKTIRIVEEAYTAYDIPQSVKDTYKTTKSRWMLEIT